MYVYNKVKNIVCFLFRDLVKIFIIYGDIIEIKIEIISNQF